VFAEEVDDCFYVIADKGVADESGAEDDFDGLLVRHGGGWVRYRYDWFFVLARQVFWKSCDIKMRVVALTAYICYCNT
jgi:hypothetical protein